MPSLSYKSGFVDAVENGLRAKPKKGERIKKQSIRKFRKIPIKKGDTLYHFFGLRTKWCRRLGTSICKSVHRVIINHRVVFIDNKELKSVDELNAFAISDGFLDWEGMRRWWVLRHGKDCFPFVGQLIKW